MQNKNKTVVKAKEILDLFLTYEQLSLQEMSTLSGQAKTTVHRMIGSLEEMGLLAKTAEGKYELGFMFLQFGQLVKERLDIRKIALPVMKQLRDDVEEAANLVIREGNEAIYIEKVDTTQPVRVFTQIGRRAALYAGACPRILLSFMPQQELQNYIEETPLVAYADGTITDKRKLIETIQEAKMRGYTISHSELRNFTSAVAVPIYNYSGQVIAGLSISGLENRFTEQRLPELIEKTVAAGKAISRNMGYLEH
ncbi:IclR family transcriptional regulator [Paenibacillus ehimensis]|uniref:IclR family transcriptional regulator n=1 Tax=Paenibacillus ehimensis TaxID=79264 RepID=A0ABT8VEY7_9BACL|nr:IclR family transcriptional regulator [Paenibacillus ehimensis]MDO3679542.1 IclR family transcriptional regulator [Paenibacillus ehimensis]